MILLKNRLGYDDSLDAFGIRGGAVISAPSGSLSHSEVSLVGRGRPEGLQPSYPRRLKVQAFAVGATILFSVTMTILIAWLVEKLVGFRVKEAVEKTGLNHELHGERASA